MTKKTESETALDDVVGLMNKQFGAGAVMRLDSSKIVAVDTIPTGSLSLDIALGVGGVPRGRVIEIIGPESGGKTTLALTIIANAQKAGGVAAFIDAEHALDPVYARALGVDTKRLLVSQPDNGEQALDITDSLIKGGHLAICVVDSVAALVPKAELDGDMGESHMGLQARLMSQAMRKITGSVARTKTCMIFINQIREKIGVMFGSPETTTGGRALKFYASVRLDVRRVATIKNGEEATGVRTKVKVIKNKVAPPFKEAQFDIVYGKGISKAGDLIDLGIAHNILEKSGAWLAYRGERLGNGRANCVEFLETNETIRDMIEKEVRDLLKREEQ